MNLQSLALSMLERNCNDPFMLNLLGLAKQGKTGEIEKIARNIAKEKGIDYDKEFQNFKNNLKF